MVSLQNRIQGEVLTLRKIALEEMKAIELDILIAFDDFCNKNNLRYFLSAGTLLGAVRHKGFIPWDDDIDVTMPRDDYEKMFEILPNILEKTNYRLISYRDKSSIYPFAKIIDKRTIVIEQMVNPLYRTGVWIDIFPLDGLDENDQPFEFDARIRKKYALLAANPDAATTPLRKTLKKILIPLARKRDLFQLALEDDKNAASIPISSNRDLGLVIWGYGKRERMPYSFLKSTRIAFEGRMFSAPEQWDLYLNSIYGDYMKLPPEDKRIPHFCDAFWID